MSKEKRKRGRPKEDNTKSCGVNIRLAIQLMSETERLAAATERNKSEYIRDAIQMYNTYTRYRVDSDEND